MADLADLKVAVVLRRAGHGHTGPVVPRESTDRMAAVEVRRKAAGVHRNRSPVAVAVAADPGHRRSPIRRAAGPGYSLLPYRQTWP